MGLSRSTLASVAAGALLAAGIGGAAVLSGTGALAASPSPDPSASSSAGAPGYAPGQGKGPGQGHGPGMGGRGMGGPGMGLGRLGGTMLHGEIVVKKQDGSGTETLLVQQGEVTAKDASTVTVKSTDGFTVVWTVTSDTRIRPSKLPTTPPAQGTKPANGTLADITVGATVDAVGTKDGDGKGTARSLGGRPAVTAQQGRQTQPGQPGRPGQPGQGWRHRGAPAQPPSSPQQPTPSPTTQSSSYQA